MSNSFLFRARSQIYPLFSSNRLENRTNHRDFIHRFSWKTWLVGCAWDTHTYSWLSTPTWVWNRSRFRRGAIRSTDFTNESDDNSELKEEGKEKKNREWTRQERERIRVNVIIVGCTHDDQIKIGYIAANWISESLQIQRNRDFSSVRSNDWEQRWFDYHCW